MADKTEKAPKAKAPKAEKPAAAEKAAKAPKAAKPVAPVSAVAAASAEVRHKSIKTRRGVVLSNKMDKTVVVEISRRYQHPKYGKFLKQRIRHKAHDEANKCNIGDIVVIEETRPLSKDKRWRVIEIAVAASAV
jgi:small subunit ribosomal protein S17